MKLVSGFVKPQFEFWLNDHIEEGKKLAELMFFRHRLVSVRRPNIEKRNRRPSRFCPES